MFVLKLSRVKAKCWRGYTQNRSGWLPKSWSWMQPDAAAAFKAMNDACGNRIEYTDVYRSAMTQIKAIRGATVRKRRLYAPPTKSGHGFGWSFDAKIPETLENFRKSKIPELVTAGKDRQSLGLWMKQFGWTGIRSESWHFNYLGEHKSTVKKIEAMYGEALKLNNHDVQKALNMLLKGKNGFVPLVVDGALGTKSNTAAKKADKLLGTKDNGAFSAWFRRVLAGATVEIEEVPMEVGDEEGA